MRSRILSQTRLHRNLRQSRPQNLQQDHPHPMNRPHENSPVSKRGKLSLPRIVVSILRLLKMAGLGLLLGSGGERCGSKPGSPLFLIPARIRRRCAGLDQSRRRSGQEKLPSMMPIQLWSLRYRPDRNCHKSGQGKLCPALPMIKGQMRPHPAGKRRRNDCRSKPETPASRGRPRWTQSSRPRRSARASGSSCRSAAGPPP